MMAKSISLLILNQTGRPVRELNFSAARLIGIALLLAIFIVLNAVVVLDYLKLKRAVPRIRQTRRTMALQSDKIDGQHRQLQLLSRDITSLKKKWTALRHLEGKIRILAGLEKTDGNSSPFGIGGFASDPPDTTPDSRPSPSPP